MPHSNRFCVYRNGTPEFGVIYLDAGGCRDGKSTTSTYCRRNVGDFGFMGLCLADWSGSSKPNDVARRGPNDEIITYPSNTRIECGWLREEEEASMRDHL